MLDSQRRQIALPPLELPLRITLAILLGFFFVVALLVVITVQRVVTTATEPDYITGLLDEVDAYDFLYDDVLDAAVTDITAQGIEFDTGLGDTPSQIVFDDPERAHAAIKAFIEEVVPREYVRDQVSGTLHEVVPYFTGRSDDFTIDLESRERVLSIPNAVRAASSELSIGNLVADGIVAPTIRDLSGDLTSDTLGITITPAEAEDAALRVLPPAWIETQLFDALDEMAPYFAGTKDDFSVRIPLQDRVEIAGEVLKEKIDEEDTAYRLTFDNVINPLVSQYLAALTVLPYDIPISRAEVDAALQQVAPHDWVQEQGDGVVDSVVDYLAGNTDSLSYTLELADRKAAAVQVITDAAREKLTAELNATRTCQSQAEATAALADVGSGRLPRCIVPGTQETVVALVMPILEREIESQITANLPDQLTYTDQDFRSQLGSSELDTLDEIRHRIAIGLIVTDQDLIDQLTPDGTTEDQSNVADAIETLRAGLVWTNADLEGKLNAETLAQVDRVRGWLGLGLSLKWLLYLIPAAFLVSVAFVGGRNWPARLKWAGGTAAVGALALYLLITIGWNASASFRNENIPIEDAATGLEANWPTVASLIEGGAVRDKLNAVLDSWTRSWANQTIPWIVVGAVLFAAGMAYPRYQDRLPEQFRVGPRPVGPGPESGDLIDMFPPADAPGAAEDSGVPDGDRDPDAGEERRHTTAA